MIKAEYKKQVLQENCRISNNDGAETLKETLREYTAREAENDPRFFSWLFDDGDIDDFGVNMTESQKYEYEDFIKNL